MKKKILIILALVLVISVLCCTVAVAEELSTDEPVTDEPVEEPVEDNTPEETEEPSITDKIQEAGDEALSWFTGVASTVSGFFDVSLICAIIAVGAKAIQLIKALKNTSFDYQELKAAYNALIDEYEEFKQTFEKYKEDNSACTTQILTELKSVREQNAALCRTLSTLINYSNLPDESKNNVLGEMNAALGYTKSEVSADEKND